MLKITQWISNLDKQYHGSPSNVVPVSLIWLTKRKVTIKKTDGDASGFNVKAYLDLGSRLLLVFTSSWGVKGTLTSAMVGSVNPYCQVTSINLVYIIFAANLKFCEHHIKNTFFKNKYATYILDNVC